MKQQYVTTIIEKSFSLESGIGLRGCFFMIRRTMMQQAGQQKGSAE